MKPVLRPPLTLLQALLLGLTLLCTVAMPVITFAQELHETEHAASGEDQEEVGTESLSDTHEGAFAGVLHAPHCCAHVAMLPQFELQTALIPPADAPRSEHSSISPAPLSRVLRPPISA